MKRRAQLCRHVFKTVCSRAFAAFFRCWAFFTHNSGRMRGLCALLGEHRVEEPGSL